MGSMTGGFASAFTPGLWEGSQHIHSPKSDSALACDHGVSTFERGFWQNSWVPSRSLIARILSNLRGGVRFI